VLWVLTLAAVKLPELLNKENRFVRSLKVDRIHCHCLGCDPKRDVVRSILTPLRFHTTKIRREPLILAANAITALLHFSLDEHRSWVYE
jgi:hypothetical protein